MLQPVSSYAKTVFISAVLLFFVYPAVLAQVKLAVFNTDVTPPIGSPVAYAKTRSVTDSLSARGIVLLSDEKPIVLCAVDWIGIANEGLQVWKQRLAEAAGTTIDRVSVHALHQHDGVHCDVTAARIMQRYGIDNAPFDTVFLYAAIDRVAQSVRQAIGNAQPVTAIGFGEAMVEKVASNRRILGDDGKVKIVRWSRTTDSAAIAAPEGLIDPWLQSVSFWNNNNPIAVMTYYATHPQSYYGQGDVTCEFVGIARNQRQQKSGVPHIHFNGAGGNITAGKYNNGSPEVRPILAERMEVAMEKAWAATQRKPLFAKDLGWKAAAADLPLNKNLSKEKLEASLKDSSASFTSKLAAAERLAWYEYVKAGNTTHVSALRLGKIWLLNLPGELFIEYQLAAQRMRPKGKVCTAAYEEYGPGYIGTKIAYAQGGYETEDRSTGVAPESEEILLKAIKKVLK